MAKKSASPFETIESAHSFVKFLGATLAETKKEISAEFEREVGDPNRRRDALLVAMYNLERLEHHLTRSMRLLNDLRSIRRMLLAERTGTAPAVLPASPHTKAAPKNGQTLAVA